MPRQRLGTAATADTREASEEAGMAAGYKAEASACTWPTHARGLERRGWSESGILQPTVSVEHAYKVLQTCDTSANSRINIFLRLPSSGVFHAAPDKTVFGIPL